jgi:hypothetical protein
MTHALPKSTSIYCAVIMCTIQGISWIKLLPAGACKFHLSELNRVILEYVWLIFVSFCNECNVEQDVPAFSEHIKLDR